ncbi:hypothetical protein Tco_0055351, partial [Tanacetum coccineum]
MSQPVSTTVEAPLPTSKATVTTITTIIPPTPQPQQSTTDPILVHRIELGEARYSLQDDSYKTNNVHKDLYEALQKSLELDYSNQHLANQEEARKKRRKRRDVRQEHRGLLSCLHLHLLHLLTTSDTRYESTSIAGAQELSPLYDLMHDDFVPDVQVQVSDDQDSGDDHTPTVVELRKG